MYKRLCPFIYTLVDLGRRVEAIDKGGRVKTVLLERIAPRT